MCIYISAGLNNFEFIHKIGVQKNAVCKYASLHGIANPDQFRRFFRR